MPEYVIVDPQTGRRYKVTGPAPPAPAVVESLLQRFRASEGPEPAAGGRSGFLTAPRPPAGQGPEGPIEAPPAPALGGQGVFEAVVDVPLGMVGIGPDTRANRVGELLTALPTAAPAAVGPIALRALAQVGRLTPKRALAGEALGTMADTIRMTAPGVYELVEPAKARLADLYRIGSELPSASNWAGAMSRRVLEAFGGDADAALTWARQWAATSANTSVPRNTKESVLALLEQLEHPERMLTVERARNLPRGGKITMAPSKVPNINRAAYGLPLGGDKVEAMAQYMMGNPRIPLDVHALYAVGTAADKLQPELKALRAMMTTAEGLPIRGALSNTAIYDRYEGALRRGLQELVPGADVNEVFATLWEGAWHHKGLKPQGGPIDILNRLGLLEVGAMLDPKKLRAALREQRWTAGAISGLMVALGFEGGGGEAAASE